MRKFTALIGTGVREINETAKDPIEAKKKIQQQLRADEKILELKESTGSSTDA